jgi:hypothetical protein
VYGISTWLYPNTIVEWLNIPKTFYMISRKKKLKRFSYAAHIINKYIKKQKPQDRTFRILQTNIYCKKSNNNYHYTHCTKLFNLFNHFNICILTLPLHIFDIIAIIVFLFVEYLPEDGWKKPKHVGGLPHICILLYLIMVQLLAYICIWYITVSSYKAR